MYFASLLGCRRARGNGTTTDSSSTNDPGSADVDTVDSSYTVTRTSFPTGERIWITDGISHTDIPPTLPSSGPAITDNNTRAIVTGDSCDDDKLMIAALHSSFQSTHFGFYMSMLCLESTALIACIIYSFIEIYLGDKATGGAIGALAYLILVTSIPTILFLLTSSLPLILLSVGTHLLSSFVLTALSVEAFTLWNLVKLTDTLRNTVPMFIIVAVIQALVAVSATSYYFKLQYIKERTIMKDAPVQLIRSDNRMRNRGITKPSNTKYIDEAGDIVVYDKRRGRYCNNDEMDSNNVAPQWYSTAGSSSSMKSFPCSLPRQASSGLESLGSRDSNEEGNPGGGGIPFDKENHLKSGNPSKNEGNPSEDKENLSEDKENPSNYQPNLFAYETSIFGDDGTPFKDTDECIIMECVPVNEEYEIESAYCESSGVDSLTTHSAYCLSAESNNTRDCRNVIDPPIEQAPQMQEPNAVKRKRMVYFASLQPADPPCDVNLPEQPDKVSHIPPSIPKISHPQRSHKMTAKQLVARMPTTVI